jgi:hypothetical protein
LMDALTDVRNEKTRL